MTSEVARAASEVWNGNPQANGVSGLVRSARDCGSRAAGLAMVRARRVGAAAMRAVLTIASLRHQSRRAMSDPDIDSDSVTPGFRVTRDDVVQTRTLPGGIEASEVVICEQVFGFVACSSQAMKKNMADVGTPSARAFAEEGP